MTQAMQPNSASREPYEHFLRHLCRQLGMPSSEHQAVLRNPVLDLGGTAVGFRLDESRRCVEVYVGLPDPPSAPHDAARQLLLKQCDMPLSLAMTFAINPLTERFVLRSAVPLPQDQPSLDNTVSWVKLCVATANAAWA